MSTKKYGNKSKTTECVTRPLSTQGYKPQSKFPVLTGSLRLGGLQGGGERFMFDQQYRGGVEHAWLMTRAKDQLKVRDSVFRMSESTYANRNPSKYEPSLRSAPSIHGRRIPLSEAHQQSVLKAMSYTPHVARRTRTEFEGITKREAPEIFTLDTVLDNPYYKRPAKADLFDFEAVKRNVALHRFAYAPDLMDEEFLKK